MHHVTDSATTRRQAWRYARWHDAADAPFGEQHCVAAPCVAPGVVARCWPPCRQERRGAAAWHWDSVGGQPWVPKVAHDS
jgi:hypothetical protein